MEVERERKREREIIITSNPTSFANTKYTMVPASKLLAIMRLSKIHYGTPMYATATRSAWEELHPLPAW